MPQLDKPKVLILTASFGEGHNTAAKNIARALEGKAEIRLADPCLEAQPDFNRKLRTGYQLVITHTPNFWAGLYYATDYINLNKPSKLLTRKPEETTHRHIEEFKPDAIVSVYPLYPYYVRRSFEKLPEVPVFTMITDSFMISRGWTAAPTDHFFTTDKFSKQIIEKKTKLSAKNVHITGFPVGEAFSTLSKLPASTSVQPFRILYFATGQKPQLRRNLRAMLIDENASTQITVVLGKNFKKLYPLALEIQQEFPDRVHIKGWTKKVPQLMTTHHLIVGKAGGATSHEAIAATTPMLIHYLLPGQEQGNLKLLQEIGGGDLADSQNLLKEKIIQLLADDAKKWRHMKQNLIEYNQLNGANNCASIILNTIKSS